MADFINRQRLVLFQLAVGAEGFLFEEAADRVVRTEEIIVGALFLFLGGEDARRCIGIELVDNQRGAGAQHGDFFRGLEVRQDDEAVALVLLFLCICQHCFAPQG